MMVFGFFFIICCCCVIFVEGLLLCHVGSYVLYRVGRLIPETKLSHKMINKKKKILL